MRRLIISAGLLLVAAAGLGAAVTTVGERPSPGLVRALDTALQMRFQDLAHNTFGMSRVPTTPEHFGFSRLKPETSQEEEAVAWLREAGWTALFYVAPVSARPRFSGPGGVLAGRQVSRPVLLAGDRRPADAPDEEDLLPALNRVLPAVKRRGGDAFETKGWHVDVRPIRAEQRECLNCHKSRPGEPPLKLGDPVGVALYAFRRSDP